MKVSRRVEARRVVGDLHAALRLFGPHFTVRFYHDPRDGFLIIEGGRHAFPPAVDEGEQGGEEKLVPVNVPESRQAALKPPGVG